MDIPKIKNPFKKEEVDNTPVEAPAPGEDESVSLDKEVNAIERPENVQEDKTLEKKEVKIEDVLQNFDLRLQRIEYHLRIM